MTNKSTTKLDSPKVSGALMAKIAQQKDYARTAPPFSVQDPETGLPLPDFTVLDPRRLLDILPAFIHESHQTLGGFGVVITILAMMTHNANARHTLNTTY